MSVPMKTPPIEVTIHSGQEYHFIGPKKNLKPLLTLLTELDFKGTSSQHHDLIPWREALKEHFAENGGEAATILRGARLKGGLSQSALAKKVGTTQGNISQMESGERPIGKVMAKRFGMTLKINYRVFL